MRGVEPSVDAELVYELLLVRGIAPLELDLERVIALADLDFLLECAVDGPGGVDVAYDVHAHLRTGKVGAAHVLLQAVLHLLALPREIRQGIHDCEGVHRSVGVCIEVAPHGCR